MTITELFEKTIAAGASDLHFVAGVVPTIRVDGKLSPMSTYPELSREDIESLVFSILTAEQKELFLNNKALDFSYGFGGGDYGERGRFRINIYYQRGTIAAAFRLLPPTVKTIEDLSLPEICHYFAKLKQGFIVVTGPTGHGKSTTIASIINEINMANEANIITIEDPIEYVYQKGKSIISQREIGQDTLSWAEALRSALREDPDVILIGEMREPEIVACEVLIANNAIKSNIREAKTHLIDSIIETSQDIGMIPLETTLATLVKEGVITLEVARSYVLRQEAFNQLIS